MTNPTPPARQGSDAVRESAGGDWWTDGAMVNEGQPGDEGFVGDAATDDDAERIVERHNAALAAATPAPSEDRLRTVLAELVGAVADDHSPETSGVCHDPRGALALGKARDALALSPANVSTTEPHQHDPFMADRCEGCAKLAAVSSTGDEGLALYPENDSRPVENSTYVPPDDRFDGRYRAGHAAGWDARAAAESRHTEGASDDD